MRRVEARHQTWLPDSEKRQLSVFVTILTIRISLKLSYVKKQLSVFVTILTIRISLKLSYVKKSTNQPPQPLQDA